MQSPDQPSESTSPKPIPQSPNSSFSEPDPTAAGFELSHTARFHSGPIPSPEVIQGY
jgi:hypothetical protein